MSNPGSTKRENSFAPCADGKRARHEPEAAAAAVAASVLPSTSPLAHLPSPALVAIMNCFEVSDVLCRLGHVNKHWLRHACAPMSFEHATWSTEDLCGYRIGLAASLLASTEKLRFAAIEARWRKYAPMMHSLFVTVCHNSSSCVDQHNGNTSSSSSSSSSSSNSASTLQAVDSNAMIASRIMVAHPSIFSRLVSIYISDWRVASPWAVPVFDVDIPAMENVRVAVVDFMMPGRIDGAEGAFTYAFASSPRLRDLTFVDVYNHLHESYIQSMIEPHAATLESLTVNASCNPSHGSSNRITKWLYPVCRTRALKSIKFIDTREFATSINTPVDGAFIACLARIHTLERISIIQWIEKPQHAYALNTISVQRCVHVEPIALRLDADGFTTDGVFRSLVRLDAPASYVHAWTVDTMTDAFPALQQLTLAMYDNPAGLIAAAMFTAMPSLHCITYMREAPQEMCVAHTASSSIADVSRALLALPEPLHVSVVQVERVCPTGMSATVRPRVTAQAEPGVMHVYTVSTPSTTPGAFLPGAQPLRLALDNISSSAVHSPHCLPNCMIHRPVCLLNATLLIVSHVGRVPDCARPLLLRT
jgi:hypothetical protein